MTHDVIPLTTTPRPMRIRAVALTLVLAALLPAAASAQQLAVASPNTIVEGSSSSSSSAAPISKRDRVSLESRLQHVALLEELYWTEHHTYTTDLAALEPSALTAPERVEIVAASAQGWTARAELSSRPGIGCVLSIGTPADRSTSGTVVASNGTAKGKRLSDPKPTGPIVVCDR
jgi:hypothetical protein